MAASTLEVAPGEAVEAPAAGGASRFALASLSLARRELVRFLRQPHRVVGALGTPVVFWLLIGGGMGGSFAGARGENYLQYFFPGTLLMILLFTAIFSTISIIEDRREGFLQGVLVAPVSRQAIVMGKVLGGTILAAGQGLVFLLLAPLAGLRFTAGGLALTAAFVLVVAFALTCLGFCIAWRMTSSQGFHAIMNLFLMPLWFLSGALFPPEGAWRPLKYVMLANPLTYGLDAIRHALWMDHAANGWHMAMDGGVSVAFAAGLFLLATGIVRRDPGDRH